MKKILFLGFCGLLCSCLFAYDPPRGVLNIFNDSEEAIYVYLKCGNSDSLPSSQGLELFHFSSANMEDASGNPIKPRLSSPEYRINAYDRGGLHIWGTVKKPRLPCNENTLTLFFIQEKTIRNYSWNDIYTNQMFVKKATLTEGELIKNQWLYIYKP